MRELIAGTFPPQSPSHKPGELLSFQKSLVAAGKKGQKEQRNIACTRRVESERKLQAKHWDMERNQSGSDSREARIDVYSVLTLSGLSERTSL